MKQNTQEINILRQYLLGTLGSEAEKDAVEKDFIADDEYFQKLEIQEELLIQDYVYNSLSTEEKRFFEQNFLISEERRKELRLVQSLQRYAHEKVTEKPEAESAQMKYPDLNFSRFRPCPVTNQCRKPRLRDRINNAPPARDRSRCRR